MSNAALLAQVHCWFSTSLRCAVLFFGELGCPHDQIIAVSKSLSRRLIMTYPTENMKEPNAASSWGEVVRVDSECFFVSWLIVHQLCVSNMVEPLFLNIVSGSHLLSTSFNIFQHLSSFSTIEGTKCAKDNGGPNCMTSQKAHRRPFSTASWSNQDFPGTANHQCIQHQPAIFFSGDIEWPQRWSSQHGVLENPSSDDFRWFSQRSRSINRGFPCHVCIPSISPRISPF